MSAYLLACLHAVSIVVCAQWRSRVGSRRPFTPITCPFRPLRPFRCPLPSVRFVRLLSFCVRFPIPVGAAPFGGRTTLSVCTNYVSVHTYYVSVSSTLSVCTNYVSTLSTLSASRCPLCPLCPLCPFALISCPLVRFVRFVRFVRLHYFLVRLKMAHRGPHFVREWPHQKSTVGPFFDPFLVD